MEIVAPEEHMQLNITEETMFLYKQTKNNFNCITFT